VDWGRIAPRLAAGAAFVLLYWIPILKLVRDWWVEPDAGHGLLLAPLAVYLAYKRGLAPDVRPQRVLGVVLLTLAILLRYVGGIAAELFTMRTSLVGSVVALIVFAYGLRQLLYWWLPLALFVLSIPLPTVILNSVAFPLQLQASRFGAMLLEWRHVPVLLQGNVIRLPGQTLFVTEACSGLRSLTSLLALGTLVGGLWLRFRTSRLLLVVGAVALAVVLNGVRVFLTGFLVFFVDPKLGQGFMHLTEGWVIFVVAFGILSAVAWALLQAEQWIGRARA
jgi:exosortase